MGRKQIIPYGLYRVEGYVSAKLANDSTKGTGFSEEDVELLWTALMNMFDYDHSASHGKMAAQKLFIFKHNNELGNAPANQLFDVITISKKDEKNAPRSFSDYSVFVDKNRIPDGVSLIERL